MTREQTMVQGRLEPDRVDHEKKIQEQEMSICFDSYPENEQFARIVVTAFLMDLNPTVDELADVKTAVSEAVTNAIIHGYEGCVGQVVLTCRKCGDEITLICEGEDEEKALDALSKYIESGLGE